MNRHKNARLILDGRKLLIESIALLGLKAAAHAACISMRTRANSKKRFQEHGLTGLMDRSSRPIKTRSTIDTVLLLRIEQLRRNHMPRRRITSTVGRSVATVSRVLARLSLPSLNALEPNVATVRYEREAHGKLLHMDTMKLGRIVRPSHRVASDRRDSVTDGLCPNASGRENSRQWSSSRLQWSITKPWACPSSA